MDLKTLRAISQAQILTLQQHGNPDDLFRAEIVGKILSDDQCFAKMSTAEATDVLMALGVKPESVLMMLKDLQTN